MYHFYQFAFSRGSILEVLLSCLFGSISQPKASCSPSAGWEASVCNLFPTPVHTVLHTRACYPSLWQLHLDFRDSVMKFVLSWRYFRDSIMRFVMSGRYFKDSIMKFVVSWRSLELKVILTVDSQQAFGFSRDVVARTRIWCQWWLLCACDRGRYYRVSERSQIDPFLWNRERVFLLNRVNWNVSGCLINILWLSILC